MPRTFSSLTLFLLALLSTATASQMAEAQDGAVYQRTRQQHSYYREEMARGAFNNGPQPYQYHQQPAQPQRYYPRGGQQQPVSGFQFQRPYPYHLDYYRMRYGGSYEPYFGNLYGPPQFYAPYYGGF